ncbi:MAG TPA: NAD-dependent malic enzyme [Vicinamibacterales bacterium]|nr:NAD-dependent malic enzyme [Vicinamibacterales bacterium]
MSAIDPLLNKGTAFTQEERVRFRLEGLLPPRVETLDAQVARVMRAVRLAPTPLERYRLLSAVQAENETLFYRAIVDHLAELLPIVYTPTVGEACLQWSRIFERPRGLYLSAVRHRGRVAEVLRHWPRSRGDLIVMTDGGRILGLGDLGIDGMGIPIGKLALYTACAGVPPDVCVPIALDVGTDNASLHDDPFYLGERAGRLRGSAYDDFLEEVVAAIQTVFPGAVVQFEDFSNAAAFALLGRYRQRFCCFNDDVQGTGAMVLGGLLAAIRLTNVRLADQRILFVGAGEACLGAGALVAAAMQQDGLSDRDANAQCLFRDSKGLVVSSRSDLSPQKRRVAQDREEIATLTATIQAFKPTVLIGASGQAGLFTRPVVEAMARLNDRPVIFALSNPTVKAECTAVQAYEWSEGRAMFASGSPFEPVVLKGRRHVPGQANNSHVFPGIGLGLLVSRAQQVTDGMFFAAARTLAAHVTDADLEVGRLFPPAAAMRDVARSVAAAVAAVAYDEGVADAPRPSDLDAAIQAFMYHPSY